MGGSGAAQLAPPVQLMLVAAGNSLMAVNGKMAESVSPLAPLCTTVTETLVKTTPANVVTPCNLGGTFVAVETLAVLRKTRASKERATVTLTLTAVETCYVGLTTAMTKALTMTLTMTMTVARHPGRSDSTAVAHNWGSFNFLPYS